MQLRKGIVARSVSGHDKDRYYVVLDVKDGYCYIADGKTRLIEKPKRKNPKHLKPTNTIAEEPFATNRQLRQFLSEWNNE